MPPSTDDIQEPPEFAEFEAAAAETLSDPRPRLECGLARYQWEILNLGSLTEPGLRPAAATFTTAS